jgi:hypothetical protein
VLSLWLIALVMIFLEPPIEQSDMISPEEFIFNQKNYLMNLLHFTVDIISAILKFASQSYLFC